MKKNDDDFAVILVKFTCRTAWTLTLIFSVLKLFGLIEWPWIKALTPLLIVIGGFILLLIIGALAGTFGD